MAENFPEHHEPLLLERDRYLAGSILHLAGPKYIYSPDAPSRWFPVRNPAQEVVVAVVGLGHLKGILELMHGTQVELRPVRGSRRTVPFDEDYVTTINTPPRWS